MYNTLTKKVSTMQSSTPISPEGMYPLLPRSTVRLLPLHYTFIQDLCNTHGLKQAQEDCRLTTCDLIMRVILEWPV